MNILLDENMPPQFRHHFPNDDVRSAQYMGWRSRHNGELVRLGRDIFDVLITKDKTIAKDARLTIEDVGVIILVPEDQDVSTLVRLVPQIKEALQTIQRGQVKWVPPESAPNYTEALH